MMIKIISIILVIISGILCSGTQQGVSSTQSGQTLQIQPNVRKYNKHTATEKPCTTGSTTGTRKDKPDSSEAQDYVAIGGPASGAGYPYPYPYPYPAYAYPYPPVASAPAGVVLVPGGHPAYRPPLQQYPYDPQYAVDTTQYYAPPYYPAAGPSPLPPPPPPPPYYAGSPYPPAPQSPYEQSVVVDAYRTLPPPFPAQLGAEQQFFRHPAGPVPPYYNNNNNNFAPPPSPHFRAHAYNGRPVVATQSFQLQQRDATATVAPATNAASANNNNNNNNAEPQYEQQQSGPFDSNQFHF